jgi:uroporphyrin-3 C-methyltransferase
MSESDQAPAVLPSEPAESPIEQDTPTSRRIHPLPLVVALLALGLSIGLAVAAYFTWNQVQQIMHSQTGVAPQVEERLQPLRASIEAMTGRQQNSRRELDKQLIKLETEADQLAKTLQATDRRIDVLTALIGRSDSGWSLAEVEYLLRIANQKLQLQRDVSTAQVALRSADTRLHELADPHYFPVRKQIARELEALQSVPEVDLDGVASTLSAWTERADQLPVAGASYQPPAGVDQEGSEPMTTAKDWRELYKVVGQSLSEVFRVREHNTPVRPMLPPRREYYLRQNLRLQLEAARLALLREDAVQYRSSLVTARSWVKDYFSVHDAEVEQLSRQLEKLSTLEVHASLPDISSSLHLLQQQMKLDEQQQSTLPPVPVDSGDTSPQDSAP